MRPLEPEPAVVELGQRDGLLLARGAASPIYWIVLAAGHRYKVKFGKITHTTRKWRNWQTHQLEGLAVAIPWGFESPLPHHHLFTLTPLQ